MFQVILDAEMSSPLRAPAASLCYPPILDSNLYVGCDARALGCAGAPEVLHTSAELQRNNNMNK